MFKGTGIKYRPPRELIRGLEFLRKYGLLEILDDIVWKQAKNIYAFILDFERISEEDRLELYVEGESMNLIDLSKGDISEITPYFIDRLAIMYHYNPNINLVLHTENIIKDRWLRNAILDEFFEEFERRKESGGLDLYT